MNPWILAGAAVGVLWAAPRAWNRLLLSRAKHRSLRGHARISQVVARLVPHYEYDEAGFFRADEAPADVVARRRDGFERLRKKLASKCPETLALSAEIESTISDVDFTNAYRVPFQFRGIVRRELRLGNLASESRGVQVRDLDGNWSYDLGGAYGVNLFGYDFYKQCIDRGADRVRSLGPLLGAYHPVIADNVRRLRAISGLDEVSFHMSGTEAVMQAVRLARYHTGRSHVVRFTGAYHGWWDGVQHGVGNPRPPREIYTLKEMDEATLRVLRTRHDIACVLVNPIQAMHPNGQAPSDSTLIASDRGAHYDRHAYARWLQRLREVCTQRGIVLILDEVFLGFRLAYGGAQQYFGVRADMVTYGKTLGGGLPVGVVCGRRDLMKRYREDRPTDICFARGTFNSHPYVMGAMSEFLDHIDRPEVREHYTRLDETWDRRVAALNARLSELALPLRVANMTSIWTTLYTTPSRYNWMFQYYLRAEGLSMSWIGSGRFIFSHNYTEADVAEVGERFVRAARAMEADGWWWSDGSLTNKQIKRRVLKELVRARLGA
ncbi:MAG: aminotransferase class III-fold pyridoxal phosphate-dependent enzyme [Planctomycetota bacterium]|nr:aminotransferase class III-fold pyridoxal phosphate-dependent enzyme [Planctomycetota bacterium]